MGTEDDAATQAEEIVVEIVDPAIEEGAGKTEGGTDALADLRSQHDELLAQRERDKEVREAAQRRAADAEREASAAREEVQRTRAQLTDSNLDTIETALKAANDGVIAAKVALRTAKEQGDIAAEVEAQDQLTTARALVMRYDEAKDDLETRKKAPPQPQQRQRPTQADPVAEYAQGRHEKVQEWLYAHPEYVTDQRKNAKLSAAHSMAMSDDIAVNTPQYFEYVEKFLGLRKGAEAEVEKKPAPQQKQPRAGAPVAPVNGGGNGMSSAANGGTVVKLTPGERDAAMDGTIPWNYDDPKGKFKKGDPIGIQEMARRKIALEKQGAYSRQYSEG